MPKYLLVHIYNYVKKNINIVTNTVVYITDLETEFNFFTVYKVHQPSSKYWNL